MSAQPAPHPGAIDIHAHMIVPEVFAVTRNYALVMLPIGGAPQTPEIEAANRERNERMSSVLADTTERIAFMDQVGVGMQVLTCSLVHQSTYWMEPDDSARYERIANDAMAKAVAAAPTRLKALGGVPLQSTRHAVAELERAVGQLGLAGVGISTFAGGREIGDPDLHPFWAKAEELGARVYIHPAGNRSPRHMRHFLWNSIGQSYEEAMAIASLMYEGVLDRYPGLRICVSHGGGYMPFNFGRLTRNWQEKPSTRTNMKQPPADFLKMLWFDSCVYDKELLVRLIEVAGADRVLLGSDYPVGDRKPVDFIKGCGLPADVEQKVLRDNAAQFLGLPTT